MARVVHSFLTRRHTSSLSLSSFNRFFSSSFSLSSITRTSSTASEKADRKLHDLIFKRYFGSSFGVGAETMSKVKGLTYSLASLNKSAYQLSVNYRTVQPTHSFYRSFASRSASEPPGQKQTEGKKDLSTMEDPFDSLTYHIPEKPVTVVEGASYSIVILVGLGIAAAAAYGVFKELIFEPKESE